MLAKCPTKQIAMVAVASIVFVPTRAEAGNWLFGKQQSSQAYPVGPPVPVNGGYATNYGTYPSTAYPGNAYPGNAYPGNAYAAAVYQTPPAYQAPVSAASPGYAANYGSYYGTQLPVIGPSGAGYSAPAPNGISAATLPSTMSYVPNYRTNRYRAPVTYYRPIMTTDPNTGAQVVAMAPCTSYEYQTQRLPAWGRSALYGALGVAPEQPAPQAMPTYTLPSGGIPLGYAPQPMTHSTTPYSTSYQGYSALQPSSVTPGVYPRSPVTTPYYGNSPSNSCAPGSYPTSSAPITSMPPQVPGLVAPQAPTTTIRPAPTWGQPTTPPSGPSPVLPPNSAPSDAGDVPPRLPQDFPTSALNEQRPQLKSIIREPSTDQYVAQSRQDLEPPRSEATFGGSDASDRQDGTSSTSWDTRDPRQDAPTMRPIPVPDNFELSPKWNPGLLKEDDLTALRAIAPDAAMYAGQSKEIRWASFEENHTAAKPESANTIQRFRPIENPNRPTSISPAQDDRALDSLHSQGGTAKPLRVQGRYESGGWKSSR